MPAVPTTSIVVGAVQPTGIAEPVNPVPKRFGPTEVAVVVVLAIAVSIIIGLICWRKCGGCGLKAKYTAWRTERNRPRTPPHLTGVDRDFWRQNGYISSLPRPQVNPRVYVDRNLEDSRRLAAARLAEQPNYFPRPSMDVTDANLTQAKAAPVNRYDAAMAGAYDMGPYMGSEQPPMAPPSLPMHPQPSVSRAPTAPSFYGERGPLRAITEEDIEPKKGKEKKKVRTWRK